MMAVTGHGAMAECVDAEVALARIPAGGTVFVEGGVGHPETLVPALLDRAARVGPLTLVTSLLGPLPEYCRPAAADRVHVLSFRGTRTAGNAIAAGQVEVVPAHLSAVPGLLRGPLRPDVALVQVTPPDGDGRCSLGPSLLYNKTAIDVADVVIAEVNPRLPRTCGDEGVHRSELDHLVYGDHPLPTTSPTRPTTAELQVADHVVGLVPNGCTVQIGMGGVGTAIFDRLRRRSGIRIHAGLLSDGIMALSSSPALADADAAIVSGAFFGSASLYDFVSGNPRVHVRPVEYTHSVEVLARLSPFVSINSGLEIDVTGQVNAEDLGGMPVSGTGGQGDFIRGAALAADGLSIIAMTATTRDALHSRIVRHLSFPGVVSTPRTDVDVVVTEVGVADLRGMSLRQRARALSTIADSRFAADLTER